MNEKELKVLHEIKVDSDKRNYFFSKVENLKWFFPLLENDFFNANSIPNQDGTGYLRDWDVLPYLERLSRNHKENGLKVPLKEIFQIIQDSTTACVQNPKKRNYRIWWYFVKIICNLNPSEIPSEILGLIPNWLKENNAKFLPSSDLVGELLPKFINAQYIKKAEQIFDYVTNYNWVEVHGYREKTALLYIEPFWLSEKLLKTRRAKEIGRLCDNELILKISRKLRDYFAIKNNINSLDTEDNTKLYRVIVELKDFDDCVCEIISIPKEIIKKEDFLYRSLRPDGYVSILNINIKTKMPSNEFHGIIDSKINNLLDILQPIKKNIINDFESLYKQIFYDYSFIWFKNLQTHDTFFADQTDAALVAILLDLVSGKSETDKDATLNLFEKFQGNEFPYPIFKRIIFHIISQNWDEYGFVFWKMIDSQSEINYFEDNNFETDIHALLRKNVNKFSDEEKERLKTIIEDGPKLSKNDETINGYTNYWRQTWFSSLNTNEFFKPYYEKYINLTKEKDRDIFSEGFTRYGPGSSPKSLDELNKMPGKELAQFLNEYKSENQWEGPNIDGLSSLLVSLFKENPDKILDSWESFLDIPYVHFYHILWGERQAWENKKEIPWVIMMNLIDKYIQDKSFWNEDFKRDDDRWQASAKWVIGETCEFLAAGTKADNTSFPMDYLPQAEKILFCIFEHLQYLRSAKPEDEGTDLFYALNSSVGKATQLLVYISLRHARMSKKEQGFPIWPQNLKNQYELLLQQNVNEAYIYFGYFLANFFFLEEQWAKCKLQGMLNVENKLWKAFYNGYLYIGSIYKNIFTEMHQHYQKMFLDFSDEKEKSDRLIEHIGVAYLQGYITIHDSLMKNILDSWNIRYIKKMIRFFWRHHGIKDNIFTERIIDFWSFCYSKLEKSELLKEGEGKEILSELLQLTCFLPQINKDNFKWLMLSASYCEINYHSSLFIEYLDQLKDKGEKIETAKWIAQIFLKMLTGTPPEYNEENIRSIIEYLYNIKDQEVKNMTNDICEIYGKKGPLKMCRDLFEKYNAIV